MATITITVTVAGGKFVLDGVSQATYSATPGNTYKFDQSNGTNATHPLRLSTTSDGTHNSGSAYTDGVTTNGTPGSAGAYTQIVVDATTVQSLFYYCSSHSGMGGAFNVGSSETVQYQQRAGFSVQNRTEDPMPYAQALADDPYGGVWSSGGTLNTARYRMVGGMGTQTLGYVVAGATPNKANVEEYNGTAWSETTDVPSATADNAAMGTATAGASIGGSSPTLNTLEIWNGASWTEGGTMPTGKTRMTAAGTTTAILAVGGAPPPGTYANTSLEYNGSSWTAGGTLPAIRGNGGQSGTQTAGFVYGGYSPSSPSTLSLTYNGTAFSATPGSLNNGYGESGFSVTGTQSSSWISGGTYPSTAKTEYYDGTSWTASGDMAQKRQAGGSLGTGTLGLYAGGSEPTLSPTTTGVTEEFAFSGLPPSTPVIGYSSAIIGDIYYNSPAGQFKTVSEDSTGTWSSGGTMNTNRYGAGTWGIKTAALAASGESGPPWTQPTVVESYDGTSWSEITELGTGRYTGASLGQTYTAALYASGYQSTYVTNVEDWDGASWTEKTEMNNPGYSFMGGVGTNTAGLAVGGNRNPAVPPSPGGNSALVEEWNGSSWTEKGDLNTGRAAPGAVGTVATAGLAIGGNPVPAGNGNKVESWDGSSWTEIAEVNNARGGGGASGTQTIAVFYGGEPSPQDNKTEYWNGTSWTEMADMAVSRNGNVGSTSQSGNSALAMSYSASAGTTEEWTKNDFQIKTVTTS
jgi:hypothetical protein